MNVVSLFNFYTTTILIITFVCSTSASKFIKNDDFWPPIQVWNIFHYFFFNLTENIKGNFFDFPKMHVGTMALFT